MPDTNQGTAAGAPAAAGLRWVETEIPITRRADELDAHLKVLDDFERAHLEEVNSTGGPIYITRRDFAILRGDLDEACRRETDYIASYWSTVGANNARELVRLRRALKLCVREMCKYCRAEAKHSMPDAPCIDGCEALQIAKEALGGEDANAAATCFPAPSVVSSSPDHENT
jgi:hypothetical protein